MDTKHKATGTVKTMLKNMGYLKPKKISNTLEGSTWRCLLNRSNQSVVVKITDGNLHSSSIIVHGEHAVSKEVQILKYLSNDSHCPQSIVKYIDYRKSVEHRCLCLVMEDGEYSLFDFVVKAHRLLSVGHFSVSEWHKMVKTIFVQMIESIEFIHRKGICHFDISLENFLISDVDVIRFNKQFTFECESAQLKLCDFGLSEVFDTTYQSNKYCGKTNYQSPEVTHRKEYFNAKANDIWCLGTCLFMMIMGCSAFRNTNINDPLCRQMMNGNISTLALSWKRDHYVNADLIELFDSIFQFEEQRVDLEQIKRCKWLNK